MTLPSHARAVLAALRFDTPSVAELRGLTAREWRKALEFCDRSQLTLILGRIASEAMPDDVRERLRSNLAANVSRLARIEESYLEIAEALSEAKIEFAVLKGFAQYPRFARDLTTRVQQDLDLMCSPDDVYRARDAIVALGYEPIAALEAFPTDHLPAMIRKTGWQWRGDYFDPGIPVSIDLHFRFWDEATERLPAPGVDEFWERRVHTSWNGWLIPCLHPVDALGYAALHLLRHLLRGSLKIVHTYELAYFLDTHAGDDGFWQEWLALHPASLRHLQAVSFRLAAEWFGCRVAPVAAEAMMQLPEAAREWFECHAAAPLGAQFRPNKSELWLHLSLLRARNDQWQVLKRRLLPARLPGPVDAVCLPDSMRTWRVRLRSACRYAAFLARRAWHHTWSLVMLCREGVEWWSRANRLDRRFWTFLGTASLFNLGMFIFVVLYNLYLVQRGYTEQDLGWINSAATAGSLAATLPAGIVARRLGLRQTVVFALVTAALACALRSTIEGLAPLVALAFLGGVAFAGWAVSIAPAIAAVIPEERRPTAFSVFFSSSIAIGIAGGWIGGHLPGWLAPAMTSASPAGLHQAALLFSPALIALALWPASRLKLGAAAPVRGMLYPRGPFITRFLLAMGIWNLGTGAFNPFFNVYFSTQHRAGTGTVGELFSVAQVAQVLALCGAPYILRRLGLLNGVAAMMAATGAALAWLAGAGSLAPAAAAYVTYMVFQWMSEPGISALLMSRVEPAEREGASALHYLTAFTAQAVAAPAAGWFLAQAQPRALLLGAASLAVAAGATFRGLLRESPAENVRP